MKNIAKSYEFSNHNYNFDVLALDVYINSNNVTVEWREDVRVINFTRHFISEEMLQGTEKKTDEMPCICSHTQIG